MLDYGTEYPMFPYTFDRMDDAWKWIEQHYPGQWNNIFVRGIDHEYGIFFVVMKVTLEKEVYVMCADYWRRLCGYDNQD